MSPDDPDPRPGGPGSASCAKFNVKQLFHPPSPSSRSCQITPTHARVCASILPSNLRLGSRSAASAAEGLLLACHWPFSAASRSRGVGALRHCVGAPLLPLTAPARPGVLHAAPRPSQPLAAPGPPLPLPPPGSSVALAGNIQTLKPSARSALCISASAA